MSKFEPHELPRQNQLEGAQPASFPHRAAAFIFDFLAVFLLFCGILIYGSKLLTY